MTSCLRGALSPLEYFAVCLVRSMVVECKNIEDSKTGKSFHATYQGKCDSITMSVYYSMELGEKIVYSPVGSWIAGNCQLLAHGYRTKAIMCFLSQ